MLHPGNQQDWYEEEFSSGTKQLVVEYLKEETRTYPKTDQIKEFDNGSVLSKYEVTRAVNDLADDLDIKDSIWWSESAGVLNGDRVRHELNESFEDSDMDPELDYSEVR